jgi:hypothetical protein
VLGEKLRASSRIRTSFTTPSSASYIYIDTSPPTHTSISIVYTRTRKIVEASPTTDRNTFVYHEPRIVYRSSSSACTRTSIQTQPTHPPTLHPPIHPGATTTTYFNNPHPPPSHHRLDHTHLYSSDSIYLSFHPSIIHQLLRSLSRSILSLVQRIFKLSFNRLHQFRSGHPHHRLHYSPIHLHRASVLQRYITSIPLRRTKEKQSRERQNKRIKGKKKQTRISSTQRHQNITQTCPGDRSCAYPSCPTVDYIISTLRQIYSRLLSGASSADSLLSRLFGV